MPSMTGRPGYRTMEMNGGSSAPYLARTPCLPLFCTLFNRGGNRRVFRLPGAGGDHFHCAVELSSGHIRCRFLSVCLCKRERLGEGSKIAKSLKVVRREGAKGLLKQMNETPPPKKKGLHMVQETLGRPLRPWSKTFLHPPTTFGISCFRHLSRNLINPLLLGKDTEMHFCNFFWGGGGGVRNWRLSELVEGRPKRWKL